MTWSLQSFQLGGGRRCHKTSVNKRQLAPFDIDGGHRATPYFGVPSRFSGSSKGIQNHLASRAGLVSNVQCCQSDLDWRVPVTASSRKVDVCSLEVLPELWMVRSASLRAFREHMFSPCLICIVYNIGQWVASYEASNIPESQTHFFKHKCLCFSMHNFKNSIDNNLQIPYVMLYTYTSGVAARGHHWFCVYQIAESHNDKNIKIYYQRNAAISFLLLNILSKRWGLLFASCNLYAQ